MKQFDILLSVDGNLEWVTEIHVETLDHAIANAIQSMGAAKYVGHHGYALVGTEWQEFSGR